MVLNKSLSLLMFMLSSDCTVPSGPIQVIPKVVKSEVADMLQVSLNSDPTADDPLDVMLIKTKDTKYLTQTIYFCLCIAQ